MKNKLNMVEKNKMLPSGLCDLLFDEANADYRIKQILIEHFLKNNFEIIKTPLLEFADNFNEDQVEGSFSTIDVISGKSLVLRNDITMQIPRLLETRLKNAPLPLRLCYEGDVLIAKNDQLYSDRQMTQAGFEIIGCKEDDYIEVVSNSVALMSQIVDKKLVLELCIPHLHNLINPSLLNSASEDFEDLLKNKSIGVLKKYINEDVCRNFCDLVTNFDDLDLIFDKFSEITSDNLAQEVLNKLFIIRKIVTSSYPNISLCYNIFGDEKKSYHKDISFKFFCEGNAYPLLKGGGYNVCNLESIGATFYINNIRRAIAI